MQQNIKFAATDVTLLVTACLQTTNQHEDAHLIEDCEIVAEFEQRPARNLEQ